MYGKNISIIYDNETNFYHVNFLSFQLTLVLTLHNLFWIINGTYEGLKPKNDH